MSEGKAFPPMIQRGWFAGSLAQLRAEVICWRPTSLQAIPIIAFVTGMSVAKVVTRGSFITSYHGHRGRAELPLHLEFKRRSPWAGRPWYGFEATSSPDKDMCLDAARNL